MKSARILTIGLVAAGLAALLLCLTPQKRSSPQVERGAAGERREKGESFDNLVTTQRRIYGALGVVGLGVTIVGTTGIWGRHKKEPN